MKKHLLGIWNPTHGTNTMDEHIKILVRHTDQYRKKKQAEEDCYVWWGKVQSQSRGKLDHEDDLLDIETEEHRNDPAPETHFYVTDFQSLYVCHVGEITTADVRKTHRSHVPLDTYAKLTVDIWFKLWDIKRLVKDDTFMVVTELKNLRDARTKRPFSIYGGLRELPMMVLEDGQPRYFDHEGRHELIDDHFWVEYDREHVGTGDLEKQLRENLLGDEVWRRLDPTTRGFIATGERVFRDNRGEPGFDYSAALIEFSKAVELETKRFVNTALRNEPIEKRSVNVGNNSVHVGDLSVGLRQLASFLEKKESANSVRRNVDNMFGQSHQMVDDLLMGLPPILKDLAEFRGPAAHSEMLGEADTLRWRNKLLGVGCFGLIPQIALLDLK